MSTASFGPLTIAYLAINLLYLNPRNARRHSLRQIRQIARSIEAFGFVVPILVNRKNEIVAGHGRYLAAKSLRRTEVPVIRLEHLSEAQAKAFAIADNRLTEISAWDDRLLAESLKELSELDLDFSIETTGFEMGEIDLRIEGLNEPADKEDRKADAIPNTSGQPAVTAEGDIWCLGRHRVCCGNALESRLFDALLLGRKANAVFIDPPYNVPIDGHASGLGVTRHRDFAMACGEMTERQFASFLTSGLTNLANHSLDGALLFACMDWRHIGDMLKAGFASGLALKNVCVWVKHNAGMGSLYRSQYENIAVFKVGRGRHRNNIELGRHGRNRSNVWSYPAINNFGRATDEGHRLKLHPTVKPVRLVADAILDCTVRGDIVLDGFLGSGTTVIAAERTGRLCFGAEIDPLYTDTIVRRWQAYTGEKAVHATSGRTFDEIAASAEVRR